MTRMQVDLIDMRSVSYGGFNYIMHAKDHFTKFSWLSVLTSKEAKYVAEQLRNIFLPLVLQEYFNPTMGRSLCKLNHQVIRKKEISSSRKLEILNPHASSYVTIKDAIL